jgi:hypothetical protein
VTKQHCYLYHALNSLKKYNQFKDNTLYNIKLLIIYFFLRPNTDKTKSTLFKSKKGLVENQEKSKKVNVIKNLVSINNDNYSSKQDGKRKLNGSKEHKGTKKIKKNAV